MTDLKERISNLLDAARAGALSESIEADLSDILSEVAILQADQNSGRFGPVWTTGMYNNGDLRHAIEMQKGADGYWHQRHIWERPYEKTDKWIRSVVKNDSPRSPPSGGGRWVIRG